MLANPFLAPKYFVILRDWNGRKTQVFDHLESLEYTNTLNDVGSFTFTKLNPDARMNDFILDGLFEIHRSVPSVGLSDYVDWIGFCRKPEIPTDENGLTSYTMSGVGLNSLLARARIGYKGGTIGADKDGLAETIIKEYVEENIGPSALVTNGREIDNVMPGLVVEASTGAGINWKGSKPFVNLLDVLKEIGLYSSMDFGIEYTGGEFGPVGFLFKTSIYHLGRDRSNAYYNPSTGLNTAGNRPVLFSIDQGNIAKAVYTYDRMQESNVMFVLGDGQGSTQDITVCQDGTRVDSPWNQWETSSPCSGYQYQRKEYGDAELIRMRAMEKFDFSPRMTKSCIYRLQYDLGDLVTVIQGGLVRHKRLTGVTTRIANDKATLEFQFADIPYAR